MRHKYICNWKYQLSTSNIYTMKKRILLLITVLATIIPISKAEGQWKLHPKFVGTDAQNLIDAGNTVYFQASNSMFYYNKATQEINVLNKDNGASDLVVTGAYYNYDANYMLIAYNNSNIDVVRADGGIINIPDIKDVIYNGKKGINDVTFAGGKAYLATEFGVVVIEDKTMQISQTYYYNTSISSVAQVGDVMVLAHDDEIFYDTRKYHDDLSKFVSTYTSMKNAKFYGIDNQSFFVTSSAGLERCSINLENTESPITFESVATGAVSYIQHIANGFIANFKTSGFYYTFDNEGKNGVKVSCGQEFFSSYPQGDGTLWAFGNNGLHIKGQNTYFTPNGWGITYNAFYGAYNPGDSKYYLSRTTDNGILNKANSSPNTATTEIWTYDGIKWRNETPSNKPSDTGNYWLVFEPGQKNSYFYSTRTKYIAHVVDGKVAQTHTTANSPLTFMNALAFDKDGNLWGVQSYREATYPSNYVIVLPNDKLNATPSKENWITPNITGKTKTNKASVLEISKGTDIKVFSIGSFNGPILFWDNEGDVNNLNPKTAVYERVNDTDGTSMQWQYVRCLTSDNKGNIWAGTTSGLFYFDPTKAFSDDFKVTRPKQSPTSMAFLLDGEDIQTIAVDSLDQVWVGTKTQGVYVLNEDGSKVLAQYDVTNSSLPSNNIWSICPIPNRNSVMFVTDSGIAEYFNEPQTTKDSNEFAHAFPNPVLPGFTGYVTIANLVNNAFVKITDRRGNVVATLQAHGKTAHWDACDATTGERLATGVYNVYAGENEESLPTEPTTQVRIVK